MEWRYILIAFISGAVTLAVPALWNVHSWPTSWHEKSDLRKKSLKLLDESDRTPQQKEYSQFQIEIAKDVSYLRLFARFVHLYDAALLKRMSEFLLSNRRKLRTTLKNKNLTVEHVEVYHSFEYIIKGEECKDAHDENECKVNRKKKKELRELMMYSMNNLSKAEDVLGVVTKRGVTQPKQVKQLLKEQDESPASALNDGML